MTALAYIDRAPTADFLAAIADDPEAVELVRRADAIAALLWPDDSGRRWTWRADVHGFTMDRIWSCGELVTSFFADAETLAECVRWVTEKLYDFVVYGPDVGVMYPVAARIRARRAIELRDARRSGDPSAIAAAEERARDADSAVRMALDRIEENTVIDDTTIHAPVQTDPHAFPGLSPEVERLLSRASELHDAWLREEATYRAISRHAERLAMDANKRRGDDAWPKPAYLDVILAHVSAAQERQRNAVRIHGQLAAVMRQIPAEFMPPVSW